MKRRVLLLLIALGALSALAAPPPNIIHIIGDDVGYDDLSCYGARDIRTPNLDRLAEQGMKFTSFYAPSPTCTPTRAALLTGCYAQRVGCPQPGAKSPHEAFYYYQNFALQAVRSGEWKLVFGALDGNGKPIESKREFLYNLEKDPRETSDVLTENAEVADRLRALAEKMREDLGDDRRDCPGRNRRLPGRVSI